MREKALIFCFSNLASDPRVRKQIFALRNSYDIITVGYSESKIEHVVDHPILHSEQKMSVVRKLSFIKSLIFNNFDSFYWTKSNIEVYKYLRNLNFDVIIANDLEALPICTRIAKEKGIKCIGDLHEYYPGQGGQNSILYNKYNTYLCRQYLELPDELITVSRGIADLYKVNFEIECKHLVTNASKFHDLDESRTGEIMRLVHHGGASRSRNIGSMIELMDLLEERFSLHLYLIGDAAYIEELKIMSQGRNIVFHPPVHNDDLIKEINQYDIGLYILDENLLNHKYCLPNKIFEFIQARLMIAITPNVDMAKLVFKYNVGCVSKDFSIQSMAEMLNGISKEQLQLHKNNTHKAAYDERDELNYDIILNIVSSIIS